MVEDEIHIVDLVRMYLEREGFKVVHAASGEDALGRVKRFPPALVILDIGLPGIDGMEVCRRLRATGSIPILVLTARADEVDRILGLELGADDYVVKPFSPRELVARVKAVLRRVEPRSGAANPISAGTVTVWPDRREVVAGDSKVQLTAKEFDLLLYLIENRGVVLTRPQILSAVWGYDYFGGERTVDAHVRTIRKKLEGKLPLTTIRGVGYKVEYGT